MSDFNLVDLYHSANITLSADDFAGRLATFNELTKTLRANQIVDLVRLYFRLSERTEGAKWFSDAFGTKDPRFSFSTNAREASILAGGLLLKALISGSALPGVAALSASIAGKRKPAEDVIDVATWQNALTRTAVRGDRVKIYSANLKPLGKTNVTKENLAAAPSIPVLAESVFLSNEQAFTAANSAITQLHAAVKEIGKDLAEAREEVEMLWWLIGGWSRALNRPFPEMGMPLSALVAGFDLADLSNTIQGPFAAEAILVRILTGVKRTKNSTFTIAQIGDSVTSDDCARLKIPSNASSYPDICPLTNCVVKSAEIGNGLAWHQAFERTSLTKTTLALSPVEIAIQAMNERLVLKNL